MTAALCIWLYPSELLRFLFLARKLRSAFGATDINKHKTLYAGIYCSPCLNVLNQKSAPCNGDNECMRRIPVKDVLEAVESFL